MIQVIEDFITPEQEQELLSKIKPSKVTSGSGRNRVVRYGSKIPYNAPISGLIPIWMTDICLRVVEEWVKIIHIHEVPDSVTINEYHKGQSIDWHIDSPTSGPIITVLSLKSQAIMGLQSPEGEEKELVLPPRSLLIMSGEEREKWKHCILPVLEPRFSIVLRKGTK